MEGYMSKEEMKQKVTSFLGNENGILLKKSEWESLKKYLDQTLTEDQKQKVKDFGIEEMEFAAP